MLEDSLRQFCVGFEALGGRGLAMHKPVARKEQTKQNHGAQKSPWFKHPCL